MKTLRQKADNIYKMKLHETIMLNNYLLVRRVAGGWIYESLCESGSSLSISSTFVPFNNEFKK